MNSRRNKSELALCIYPSAKGFGFAIFEDSRSLVDWGVTGVHGKKKNAQSIARPTDWPENCELIIELARTASPSL